MNYVHIRRPSVIVHVKAPCKPANHTSLTIVVCNEIDDSFVIVKMHSHCFLPTPDQS